MTYLVPKEQPSRQAGYIDKEEDVTVWWDKNKDRQWNPERGIYLNESHEPSDDQLKEIEKKLLDKSEVAIEACFSSEVVSEIDTSNGNETLSPPVPFLDSNKPIT